MRSLLMAVLAHEPAPIPGVTGRVALALEGTVDKTSSGAFTHVDRWSRR